MPKNIDIIRLIDFAKHFPDENSCRETFKRYREHEGIVCKKCGNKTHYWKKKFNKIIGRTRLGIKSSVHLGVFAGGLEERLHAIAG